MVLKINVNKEKYRLSIKYPKEVGRGTAGAQRHEVPFYSALIFLYAYIAPVFVFYRNRGNTILCGSLISIKYIRVYFPAEQIELTRV